MKCQICNSQLLGGEAQHGRAHVRNNEAVEMVRESRTTPPSLGRQFVVPNSSKFAFLIEEGWHVAPAPVPRSRPANPHSIASSYVQSPTGRSQEKDSPLRLGPLLPPLLPASAPSPVAPPAPVDRSHAASAVQEWDRLKESGPTTGRFSVTHPALDLLPREPYTRVRTCVDLPLALKDLKIPPKSLQYLGNTELLSQPALSVVGSRSATSLSLRRTRSLIASLSGEYVIVSGGAFGVDATAHRAALDSHAPTVVVLPCGVDVAYPRQHDELYEEILAAGGLLISEYDDGTPAARDQFLARNRIIAALGLVMYVGEAQERSGSSSAVRAALDLGRPVAASLGPAESAYQYTNSLIGNRVLSAVMEEKDLAELLRAAVLPAD